MEITRISSPIGDEAGFVRYSVRTDGGDLLGEVFPFYPDADARTHRWLAQRRDGTVYGFSNPIRTRRDAIAALTQ